MLTNLVEKYDIYFNEQAKRRSVHVNGYCSTELTFDTGGRIGYSTKILYMPMYKESLLLRARRNEKEFKVKPATSFKYFQYLLTKNYNKVQGRENII